MHLYYTKKCSKAPHFPGWDGSPTKPPLAASIFVMAGSWRFWQCMACGKIPAHPSAPPIQEYLDHKSDNEEEQEWSPGSEEFIIQ
jgi:hypothetical protein